MREGKIMKQIKLLVPLLMCMTVFISSCGKEKTEDTVAQVIEPIEFVVEDQQDTGTFLLTKTVR